MQNPRMQLLLRQSSHAVRNGQWFPSLAHSLEGVTAAEASWLPREGARLNTIWQLVNHLTYWKKAMVRLLRDREEVLPDPAGTAFGKPGNGADEEGWQEAVEALFAASDELDGVIASLPDEALDWAPEGDLPSPAQVLVGMVEHDAYHGGQIVLLRKLQGTWKGH